jgi:hypothetical protein
MVGPHFCGVLLCAPRIIIQVSLSRERGFESEDRRACVFLLAWAEPASRDEATPSLAAKKRVLAVASNTVPEPLLREPIGVDAQLSGCCVLGTKYNGFLPYSTMTTTEVDTSIVKHN